MEEFNGIRSIEYKIEIEIEALINGGNSSFVMSYIQRALRANVIVYVIGISGEKYQVELNGNHIRHRLIQS